MEENNDDQYISMKTITNTFIQTNFIYVSSNQFIDFFNFNLKYI